MKSECQAYSVKTRARARVAGSAPPKRSWTKRSLPSAWPRKSPRRSSNCSGVIAALLSHQTSFSVLASRTTNLSRGERPVWTPVSAASAPPRISWASRFASACS